MRLLIATPAFGGLVTTNYLRSMIDSVGVLYRDKIDFSVLTVANESLISRARNGCATHAMEKGFDKMMFIDADIGWKWSDLLALVNSDKLVVGGTYPLKQLPLSLNYNVFPEHSSIFPNMGIKSLAAHSQFQKHADSVTGEIAVRDMPTGFLMIDTRVLHALADKVPKYTQHTVGQPDRVMYDFFPVRVREGIMESEDWAFCSLCRDNGIPVYLNTNIVCNHTGTYTFG